MSNAVREIFNFTNQTVLDCGCGDGKYAKTYMELADAWHHYDNSGREAILINKSW
jgi:ubiquinone/menaquinone biosynthesis C-methylase UbiE